MYFKGKMGRQGNEQGSGRAMHFHPTDWRLQRLPSMPFEASREKNTTKHCSLPPKTTNVLWWPDALRMWSKFMKENWSCLTTGFTGFSLSKICVYTAFSKGGLKGKKNSNYIFQILLLCERGFTCALTQIRMRRDRHVISAESKWPTAHMRVIR